MNKKINYDVFISYRRAIGGWAEARLICEMLKNTGLNVFLDVDILNQDAFGADFLKTIDEALISSKIIVLVLAQNSLDRCLSDKNDVLAHEIELAQQLKKVIIPLTTSCFSFPETLTPSLQKIQQLNTQTFGERNYKNLVDNIAKLAIDLGSDTFKSNKQADEYIGLVSVKNGVNYLINYETTKLDKDIIKKELNVYERNLRKIFNGSKQNVELSILSVDNKK